jgi:hypothetical protein
VPEALDPHDVGWIDAEHDDEGYAMPVKTVTMRVAHRRPNQGHGDTEFIFEVRRFLPSVLYCF